MSKSDFKSQKEAAWACTNLVSGGSENQVGVLVNSGDIRAFCNMLTVSDVKVVTMVLESLRRILKVAQAYGQEEQLCLSVEECGGLDKLEQLQEHDNARVYDLAYRLVDDFFSADSEDDGDASASATDKEFAFKVQEAQANDGAASACHQQFNF